VWQDTWWPGVVNPAIIGDMANPSGDGIVNLLKRALGLDPTLSATNGLPTGAIIDDRLQITFTRMRDATDLMYHVDASGDLLTPWSEIWSTAGVPYGGGNAVSQTVSVPDVVVISAPGVSNRFLRLRITN
jgi:hypothetical protein